MTTSLITDEFCQQRLAQYHSSPEFKTLTKTYDLSTTGTWKASTGEDGMAFKPQEHLGYFTGKLEDVVKHLVLLCPTFQGFHCWGSINQIDPVVTDPLVLSQQIMRRNRKAKLEREIAELDSRIL